jgi:hypothetical protein
VAVVRNIEEGIINVNYKAIIEVLIEIYFKIITKRSATFITKPYRKYYSGPVNKLGI